MQNIIVFIIIALAATAAIILSIRRARGKSGGCCGAHDAPPPAPKTLGNVVERKFVSIQGMHCDHCKTAVESALNKIEGASASVCLRTDTATVQCSRHIDDDEIKRAVDDVGFTVTKIESAPAIG